MVLDVKNSHSLVQSKLMVIRWTEILGLLRIATKRIKGNKCMRLFDGGVVVEVGTNVGFIEVRDTRAHETCDCQPLIFIQALAGLRMDEFHSPFSLLLCCAALRWQSYHTHVDGVTG